MPPPQNGEIVYRVFKVAWGWCAAARGSRGLKSFILPVDDKAAAEAMILRRHPEARHSRDSLRPLVKLVKRYFHGWTTKFGRFKIDLGQGTEFQQRVWEIARRIPYGEVRTYRWIGMEMGRPEAVRAIGGAMGANPFPLIVPCHRVVASNGALGGFSAEGGVDLKARMLRTEKLHLVDLDGEVRVVV